MSHDAPARFLTIQQLSRNCGLSIATLHRLKRQGKLPFYQPAGKGGRLLFPPDAIERISVSHQQSSSDSSEAGPRKHLSGRCPAWMQTIDTPQETSTHAT
jgi:hypothetical protein